MLLPRLALSLAAASLVLTACSDGSDAGSPDGSADASASVDPGGVEAAEEVVRSFYADLGAKDYDAACGWWTDDYVAASVEAWNDDRLGKQVATCPQLLTQIVEVVELVGEAAETFEVGETSGELVDDDTARVGVTLSSSLETETYELTRTDDGWLISGDGSSGAG